MSEQFDDGGNVFPVAEDHKVAADLPWTCGMTLLDYFAGQIAHAEHVRCGDDWGDDELAAYCYKRAAAMIRRKRVLERVCK